MRPAELLSRLIDRCYLPPLRRIMPAETFRYAACGGLNMAADAVWYCMIYHFVVAERFFDLGVVVLSPHIAAMLAVFPITFFTGFWLNRHVAFRTASQPAGRQLFRYALSIVGSVLLTYGGLKFFVEVCGWWPTPSKLLTTAVTVVYSYLAARHFTFTGKRENRPAPVRPEHEG